MAETFFKAISAIKQIGTSRQIQEYPLLSTGLESQRNKYTAFLMATCHVYIYGAIA